MKRKRWCVFFALAVVMTFAIPEALPNPAGDNAQSISHPIVVDKVVANPEKFKGPIDVSGRVGKLGTANRLFALSCEDECFSMPVRFSGAPPKPGSDVVVHGQLTKESNGRYVFNADSVTLKK